MQLFFFMVRRPPRSTRMTHSFPTRRSSDLDGLEHDAVRVACLRRQVEQHRVDPGVGQVRGDQRAHDAGAEHRGPTYKQFVRHLRSEEHTSELQSLMRISYAVFCLKKKQ